MALDNPHQWETLYVEELLVPAETAQTLFVDEADTCLLIGDVPTRVIYPQPVDLAAFVIGYCYAYLKPRSVLVAYKDANELADWMMMLQTMVPPTHYWSVSILPPPQTTSNGDTQRRSSTSSTHHRRQDTSGSTTTDGISQMRATDSAGEAVANDAQRRRARAANPPTVDIIDLRDHPDVTHVFFTFVQLDYLVTIWDQWPGAKDLDPTTVTPEVLRQAFGVNNNDYGSHVTFRVPMSGKAHYRPRWPRVPFSDPYAQQWDLFVINVAGIDFDTQASMVFATNAILCANRLLGLPSTTMISHRLLHCLYAMNGRDYDFSLARAFSSTDGASIMECITTLATVYYSVFIKHTLDIVTLVSVRRTVWSPTDCEASLAGHQSPSDTVIAEEPTDVPTITRKRRPRVSDGTAKRIAAPRVVSSSPADFTLDFGAIILIHPLRGVETQRRHQQQSRFSLLPINSYKISEDAKRCKTQKQLEAVLHSSNAFTAKMNTVAQYANHYLTTQKFYVLVHDGDRQDYSLVLRQARNVSCLHLESLCHLSLTEDDTLIVVEPVRLLPLQRYFFNKVRCAVIFMACVATLEIHYAWTCFLSLATPTAKITDVNTTHWTLLRNNLGVGGHRLFTYPWTLPHVPTTTTRHLPAFDVTTRTTGTAVVLYYGTPVRKPYTDLKDMLRVIANGITDDVNRIYYSEESSPVPKLRAIMFELSWDYALLRQATTSGFDLDLNEAYRISANSSGEYSQKQVRAANRRIHRSQNICVQRRRKYYDKLLRTNRKKFNGYANALKQARLQQINKILEYLAIATPDYFFYSKNNAVCGDIIQTIVATERPPIPKPHLGKLNYYCKVCHTATGNEVNFAKHNNGASHLAEKAFYVRKKATLQRILGPAFRRDLHLDTKDFCAICAEHLAAGTEKMHWNRVLAHRAHVNRNDYLIRQCLACSQRFGTPQSAMFHRLHQCPAILTVPVGAAGSELPSSLAVLSSIASTALPSARLTSTSSSRSGDTQLGHVLTSLSQSSATQREQTPSTSSSSGSTNSASIPQQTVADVPATFSRAERERWRNRFNFTPFHNPIDGFSHFYEKTRVPPPTNYTDITYHHLDQNDILVPYPIEILHYRDIEPPATPGEYPDQENFEIHLNKLLILFATSYNLVDFTKPGLGYDRSLMVGDFVALSSRMTRAALTNFVTLSIISKCIPQHHIRFYKSPDCANGVLFYQYQPSHPTGGIIGYYGRHLGPIFSHMLQTHTSYDSTQQRRQVIFSFMPTPLLKPLRKFLAAYENTKIQLEEVYPPLSFHIQHLRCYVKVVILLDYSP